MMGDLLVNESDRGQNVAGTSVNASPTLAPYRLDPDPAKWSAEEAHEYAAAVEMSGPLPTNAAHRELRERENRGRAEERLAHLAYDRQIAAAHAASIGASWSESIHRHVRALLILFADPHHSKDVARNLVLDQLRQELADATAQLWSE